MAKGNPVIVTGNRSPGDGATSASAHSPVATASVAAKPGVRRYAASFPAFRLTLIDQKSRLVDGKVIEGERLTAQFENGVYETDVPRTIELIEKSKPWKRKQIWDADEMVAVVENAKEEAALKLIEDNPRLAERLKQRLAIKDKADFKLPPPPSDEQGAGGTGVAATS